MPRREKPLKFAPGNRPDRWRSWLRHAWWVLVENGGGRQQVTAAEAEYRIRKCPGRYTIVFVGGVFTAELTRLWRDRWRLPIP